MGLINEEWLLFCDENLSSLSILFDTQCMSNAYCHQCDLIVIYSPPSTLLSAMCYVCLACQAVRAAIWYGEVKTFLETSPCFSSVTMRFDDLELRIMEVDSSSEAACLKGSVECSIILICQLLCLSAFCCHCGIYYVLYCCFIMHR